MPSFPRGKRFVFFRRKGAETMAIEGQRQFRDCPRFTISRESLQGRCGLLGERRSCFIVMIMLQLGHIRTREGDYFIEPAGAGGVHVMTRHPNVHLVRRHPRKGGETGRIRHHCGFDDRGETLFLNYAESAEPFPRLFVSKKSRKKFFMRGQKGLLAGGTTWATGNVGNFHPRNIHQSWQPPSIIYFSSGAFSDGFLRAICGEFPSSSRMKNVDGIARPPTIV